MKQWTESGEITYYKRYVDDSLITFDQNKANEDSIMNHMNNVHEYLEFKLTEQEHNKLLRSHKTQTK
jgi:hypothetical protein